MKKIRYSLFLLIPLIILLYTCEDVDNTPPTVSISSHYSGQSISEIVTIKVSTGDNGGIEKVEFYINDELALTISKSPFEYSWNTAEVEDGEYIIKAISYDNSGNFTESQPIMLIVDNSGSYPQSVSINSITYTQTEMTIVWMKSTDSDFNYYELLSSDSEDGNKNVIVEVMGENDTSLVITEFNPSLPTWYWIAVTDTVGLTTIGNGYFVTEPVYLFPQDGIYNRHLRIKWNSKLYARYIVNISSCADFSKQVRQISAHQDTSLITNNLPGDTQGCNTAIENGRQYYVKISTYYGNGFVDSNVEIFKTSYDSPIYIPYDDENLSSAIIEGDGVYYILEGEYSMGGQDGLGNCTIIGLGEAEKVIINGGPLRGGGDAQDTIKVRNLTMANHGTAIQAGSNAVDVANVRFHDYSDIVIQQSSNSYLVLKNCIFYNNSFKVFSIYENAIIENCVFYNNNDVLSLNPKGDPSNPTNSNINIVNCVFYDNYGENIKYSNFPAGIPNFVNMEYSNVNPQYNGTGNITGSPGFIDANIADFRLQSTSPCIDAGNPLHQYNDVDGTRNNMGAYGGAKGEW